MKLAIISTVICVASLCAIPAQATLVDISAATNKPVYELGEEVVVFVIAYNPNPEPVTLTGGFYFASYIMDGVYDWAEGRSGPQVIMYVTIDPDDSVTWELSHGLYEMQEFPLGVGVHTVVGEVLAIELFGDGKSAPIEFEIVPEPSTLLLFVLGLIGIRRKRPICRRQL